MRDRFDDQYPEIVHRLIGIALMILVLPPRLHAQSGSAESDSLREYRLSEIVIGAQSGKGDSVPRTIDRVSLASLVRQDAADISGVMRLLPSAHLQTNSRGETLVYLRGAGERQVALFLDGASLNIPWDNRIDLSMIPSNILGGVSVARGAVSASYGTNVSGGAVNLQTRDLATTGSLTEFTGQFGTGRAYEGRGMHLRRFIETSLIVAGTVEGSAGQTVSKEASLPYSQSGDLRTNTDRMLGNVFVRLGRNKDGNSSWGLSMLHVEARKGIAPESHLNPEKDRVRYWRYPDWRNSMAIFNGRSSISDQTSLLGTVWLGRFEQQINQYQSARYELLTDRQNDRDLTGGARLVVEQAFPNVLARLVGNVLYSRHDQQDREYDSHLNAETVLDELYSQILFSVGTEYDIELPSDAFLTIGATYDGFLTPRTGDKPARDAFTSSGFNLQYARPVGNSSQVRLSAGRKVRFPTMRELFGEALDLFMVNPELTSESKWIGEASLGTDGTRASGELVAFVHRTVDTIDRRNVTVDGRHFRQRVNLEGSRVLGLEGIAAFEVGPRLHLDGHITMLRPVGFEDGETVHLVEKPEVLATVSAVWTSRRGISLSGQSVLSGRAYSLNPENEQIALPTSAVFNVRTALRRYLASSGLFLEAYAGIDNITDDLRLPQLGLPGPGRTFRIGLSITT